MPRCQKAQSPTLGAKSPRLCRTSTRNVLYIAILSRRTFWCTTLLTLYYQYFASPTLALHDIFRSTWPTPFAVPHCIWHRKCSFQKDTTRGLICGAQVPSCTNASPPNRRSKPTTLRPSKKFSSPTRSTGLSFQLGLLRNLRSSSAACSKLTLKNECSVFSFTTTRSWHVNLLHLVMVRVGRLPCKLTPTAAASLTATPRRHQAHTTRPTRTPLFFISAREAFRQSREAQRRRVMAVVVAVQSEAEARVPIHLSWLTRTP
mmetsp:Transcript_21319/g.55640  ORF Transcript_21319/g.55640 Transcript_21319/m.55640 type:complete len:260 (+) Transcript_21319:380-1159(+)